MTGELRELDDGELLRRQDDRPRAGRELPMAHLSIRVRMTQVGQGTSAPDRSTTRRALRSGASASNETTPSRWWLPVTGWTSSARTHGFPRAWPSTPPSWHRLSSPGR